MLILDGTISLAADLQIATGGTTNFESVDVIEVTVDATLTTGPITLKRGMVLGSSGGKLTLAGGFITLTGVASTGGDIAFGTGCGAYVEWRRPCCVCRRLTFS